MSVTNVLWVVASDCATREKKWLLVMSVETLSRKWMFQVHFEGPVKTSGLFLWAIQYFCVQWNILFCQSTFVTYTFYVLSFRQWYTKRMICKQVDTELSKRHLCDNVVKISLRAGTCVSHFADNNFLLIINWNNTAYKGRSRLMMVHACLFATQPVID